MTTSFNITNVGAPPEKALLITSTDKAGTKTELGILLSGAQYPHLVVHDGMTLSLTEVQAKQYADHPALIKGAAGAIARTETVGTVQPAKTQPSPTMAGAVQAASTPGR